MSLFPYDEPIVLGKGPTSTAPVRFSIPIVLRSRISARDAPRRRPPLPTRRIKTRNYERKGWRKAVDNSLKVCVT